MKNVIIFLATLAALATLAPEGEIKEEPATPVPLKEIRLNVDRCYADPH